MKLNKLETLKMKVGRIYYYYVDEEPDDILVDELLIMEYDGVEFVVDIESIIYNMDGCLVNKTWEDYVREFIEQGEETCYKVVSYEIEEGDILR